MYWTLYGATRQRMLQLQRATIAHQTTGIFKERYILLESRIYLGFRASYGSVIPV